MGCLLRRLVGCLPREGGGLVSGDMRRGTTPSSFAKKFPVHSCSLDARRSLCRASHARFKDNEDGMQEARQIFTQLDDLDKEDMNMNHKPNTTKGTRRQALAKGKEGDNKLETL